MQLHSNCSQWSYFNCLVRLLRYLKCHLLVAEWFQLTAQKMSSELFATFFQREQDVKNEMSVLKRYKCECKNLGIPRDGRRVAVSLEKLNKFWQDQWMNESWYNRQGQTVAINFWLDDPAAWAPYQGSGVVKPISKVLISFENFGVMMNHFPFLNNLAITQFCT